MMTALLEKGDAALKKGDWEGAIDAWQKILGDFPGAVLPAEDGIWLPATVTCSRKLAALPPPAIAAYRDRYEAQAAQKLGLGTEEGLRIAAERFFCTDSGGVAMERLGGMHADAGSIELAMRCGRICSKTCSTSNVLSVRMMPWETNKAMTSGSSTAR